MSPAPISSRYSAAADRLEMIGDGLREQVDREAALRAVAYCRARDAGGRENVKAEAEINALAKRGFSRSIGFSPARHD